ncbi:MAG: hypothetical protein D6732_14200 [Methanobacteriota archaeon]|nr:MAG: hypothetical protein D6732_14200 [Euryarchaeota archaeon]
MAFLSVFLGWLHVMFAVIAVGGSIFNYFILAPILKEVDLESAGKVAMGTGKKFTQLIWISLVGLILTGILRVAADTSFQHAFGFDSSYGVVMNIKMLFVIGIVLHAALITRTAVKIGQAKSQEERAMLQQKLRRFSFINILLAVIVIFLAVGLRYGGSII